MSSASQNVSVCQATLAAARPTNPPPKRVNYLGRWYSVISGEFQKAYAFISSRIAEVFQQSFLKTAPFFAYAVPPLLWYIHPSFFSLGFFTGLLFTKWTEEKIEILKDLHKSLSQQGKVKEIFLTSILAASCDFGVAMGAFCVGSYFGTIVRGNTLQTIPEVPVVHFCGCPHVRNGEVVDDTQAYPPILVNEI
jgi:hypothetical protein